MLVITTPTGDIGHQVVQQLLDGGEPVRVIVRDPARLAPRVREQAEVVTGSHDDPAVVGRAFAGADAVFWLVPPNPRVDNVTDYYLDFTRPACAAITEAGVPRVVAVSTLGEGIVKNGGPLSAALAMDELIESTGAGYRSLRMPFFMDNFLRQLAPIRDQGVFFLASTADRRLATVATRDIAAVAAGLLTDRGWTGREGVPVAGPDDLSPDQMAAVMSEVLGRPVRCQQVPLERYKASMLERGMSEGTAQGMVDMAVAQNTHDLYDLAPGTPRTATSFRQWCQEVLKPAVAG